MVIAIAIPSYKFLLVTHFESFRSNRTTKLWTERLITLGNEKLRKNQAKKRVSVCQL